MSMAQHTSRAAGARYFVSEIIFTLCLTVFLPGYVKMAGTWRQRHIWITDRIAWFNYDASLSFASLALILIGLIVVWTGYRKRNPWAWLIMLIFVAVYYVPVHLIDVFLDIKTVGWRWWPGVVQDAREGRPFARGSVEVLIILVAMTIALVLPIKEFFGKTARSPRA